MRGGLVPWLGLTLILLTLAVYWPVGDHPFLSYDDNDYVTENAHVATGLSGENLRWAFTSVEAWNWHPLTWLSHQVDAQLYGMNPRGHHLTNVILHAAATLLLLLLLFRLTGSPWKSAFVAALFALHPLHVESVAWVAERKDVLSAFFWFLTLLLYSQYAERRGPALYLCTLFSFLLGLMAKPMVVTLPLVMVLLDYWPLNRYRFTKGESRESLIHARALFKEKIPFLAGSLLSSAITIYAQHTGGAVRSLDTVPFGFRLENALTAYGKYITKTLWPVDLAVFYPLPASIPLWQVIGALLLLLLVSAATMRLARRQPYLLVGWFWFLITLLPVIGLIQVGLQSLADRYSYLPSVGLFIMVAWGVPALLKDLPHQRIVLAVTACALIVASALTTRQQLTHWRDSIALFSHALKVTSGSYLIHSNLGNALTLAGRFDEAIQQCQAALRIKPDYLDAHNNLGNALAKRGDLDGAIREFQTILARDPNHLLAHNNLGNALAAQGRLEEAVGHYQEALRINPDDTNTHYNLGNAFAKKGDVDRAIQEFQAALRTDPHYTDARNNLGNALSDRGDLDEAIRQYRLAIGTAPDHFNTRNNLAIALARKGDLDGAISEFQAALRISPNSATYQNLRLVLMEKERRARGAN